MRISPQVLATIPLTACTVLYAQVHLTAPQSNYQPPVTIISDTDQYRVNPDYSYQETETRTIRINSQVGVKQFSQIPLSYNPDLEQIEVVKAYTTKPDGRQIPVEKAAILDRQSAASADAPMFNSDRVKTVIFPDTAVGDSLTIEIKKDGKPLFPNSFSVSSLLPPVYTIEHAEIQIDMPATLNLYTDAPGMTSHPQETKGDRKIWRWSLDKQPGIAPEAGMAFTPKTSTAVFATTLQDEQAGADAYLARAKDKAAVSTEVQQQADAITQGISDKKAQAEAIYNWVSSNIRYVAVYFGAGGVVPHSAAEILKNRYGDCKDHVTLLEALLSAKGIDSQAVLVNAGNYYGIPKVAVMPGVFDHVITYLPEFDLYLDSTAEVATFGVLPASELGKVGLVLSADKAKIVTLPLSTPTNNSVTATTEITLNADGSGKGSSNMSQKGAADWLVRMIAVQIPQGMEAQVAQQYLQMTGQSGKGTYHFGKPRLLTQPFTYQSDFSLRDVFDSENDGAFRLPLGVAALNGINANTFGALTAVNKRERPFVLNGHSIKAVTHIQLPKNITINKLPKDFSFANELGEYQAHYSQQGQDITVTRELIIKEKPPVTPAAAYPQLRTLNDAVNKDLRRQVLYSVQ